MDIERDIRYISNPSQWIRPVLPIIRPKPYGSDCAYLIDGPAEDGSVTIFRGNIFNIQASDRAERFESVSALIAAGWRVD